MLGAGTLVKWQPGGDVQVIQADITGIYPGVHWRRSVALTGGVVVIVDASIVVTIEQAVAILDSHL